MHGSMNVKLLIISRSVLLKMRNVSGTNCGESQNTYIISNNFFFSENRAVYEITWKNTEEHR
jgi:hypothetical protein